MTLRTLTNDMFDDEDFMERRLGVRDNDITFGIVLCVFILGGICACIKCNSCMAAATMRERELNEQRAQHSGGEGIEEPPREKRKKKKKKKTKSSEETETNGSIKESL